MDFSSNPKLNLGCGNLKLDGYVNIDISTDCNPDIVWDITKGLPQIKDNSIDEIHAGCVLEQFTPEQFLLVLNECNRVLVEGGKLHGYVPSTDPRVLHLDPMDKMFFQLASFEYLDKTKHAWREFGRNYGFTGWSSNSTRINENGILFFELIK